jgi:hypothetical protein
LVALRHRLAAGRDTSTLFDARRFARNLDTAFETMMAIHRSGADPHGFAVTDDSLAGPRWP